MTRFLLLLIALSILPSLAPRALAHSGSTDFGSIESIQAGHYHFHLPVEIDLQGHLQVHSWMGGHSKQESGGHEGHEGEPSESHEGHSGSLFTLVLSGEVDRIRRTVVRRRLELTPESWKIPLASNEDPRFKLIARRRSWGVGPDAHLGSLAVGLLPGKESVFFHRRSCSSSRCASASLRRFPLEISEWIGVQPGERVSHSKATAIHAHIGIDPLAVGGLGPILTLEGAWSMAMELLENDELQITVGRDRMKAAGVEAEAVILAAGAVKHWSKGYDYEFRLNPLSAESAEAYRLLLQGRIDAVQKLSQAHSSVRFVDRSTFRSRGRSYSAGAGLPVLTGIAVESTLQTISTREGDETTHVSIQQELIRGRGVLSRHLLKGKFIVASAHLAHSGEEPGEDEDDSHSDHDHDHDGSEDHEPADHADHPAHARIDLGLTSLWIFEKDRARDERVERWLRRLGGKFGIPELSKLSIHSKSKGYLRGELRVHFPTPLLRQWLKLETDSDSAELPQEVRQSARWKSLSAKIRRAERRGDARGASRSLAKAGNFLVRHLKAIRREAVKSGKPLPLVYEIRLSGDSIPETVKAWRVRSERAR